MLCFSILAFFIVTILSCTYLIFLCEHCAIDVDATKPTPVEAPNTQSYLILYILFFAESGGAEESLGVFSGGCFENQCAIGRGFNLYRVVRTADGGDLLLGPEDVQLSERDGVIDGLDNKKRTERRQIRFIGRAVIVCAVDGCVSQIRAWVGTGSRARGRARVGVPSEVIGRAVVIAPGEVRTRARVGTG